MITRIPFVAWEPDKGEVDNLLFELTDAVPAPQGYSPAIIDAEDVSLAASTNSTVLGGLSVIEGATGSKFHFFGTDDNLYRGSATATTDNVSSTANVYTSASAGAGGRWDFVQWGDDVIATNFEDSIQTMGISATAFATLSSATATPRARCIGSARNFVIVGNTYTDTDGTTPNRVQWSALNDATDWVVSAATQSDFQDLRSGGGKIQRIFGGEYAVVFQENAISRMTYVGPPLIWQFDEVVSERGLRGANAAAQVDNKIFFLAQDGFFVLQNGSQLTPIGKGRVNNYFNERIYSLSEQALHYVSCAADPSSSRVYWAYPTSEPSTANWETLVYDYSFDKWGKASLSAGNQGFMLSILNDAYGNGIGRIAGGSGSNTGAGMLIRNTLGNTFELETGILSLAKGRNALVNFMSPGFANINFATQGGSSATSGYTVTAIGYNNPYDINNTSTSSVNVSSTSTPVTRAPIRKNAKFHKFRVKLQEQSTEGTSASDISPFTDRRAELKWVQIDWRKTHWR